MTTLPRSAVLLVVSLLWGCSSVRLQGTVVELSGTVNPLRLNSHVCWMLETGSMQEKAFYELHGSERLLQQLRRENAQVRLRALVRPECRPSCGVGTCIEVVEILSVQP